MRLKIFGLFAAVALLAACETAPEESAASSGAGAGAGVGDAKIQESFTTSLGGVGGPQRGSQEDLVVNVGDRVFFDFDKYSLDEKSRAVLYKQAAWMGANPGVRITIEGHADERGTREYNLALGERRASAVKDYLVALGVAPNRVDTISYGKERPVALGSNAASWAQNRRGVTRVDRAGS